MPVPILSNRDHGDPGAHPVQEGITGGARRPVVSHFQHVRVPQAQRQRRLGGKARIPREDRVEGSVAHPQDHRVLVRRQVRLHPGLGRVQHGQGHRIQRQGIAGAGRAPRGSSLIDRPLELEVERCPQRLTRFDHQVRRQEPGHRGKATQVIGVAVSGDHEVERADPLPAEERQHHAPPGVARGGSGAAIHQRPTPAWRAEHDGVALPNVQHVQTKLLTALT